MPHLVLALHFLALIAGAASFGQAVMIWLRHRKTVVRHYALFLLSTWLILLALAVDLYGRNAGLARDGAIAALTWILQAAGGLLYIGASPFFYHSLMGLEMRRWSIAACLVVAVAILLWSIHRWAYQKRAASLIPLLLIVDALLAVRLIEASL